MLRPLRVAWSFFTRLPGPPHEGALAQGAGDDPDGALGASMAWWPTAALPVAAVAVAAGTAGGVVVSPALGAVAAMAAMAWFTRGFHLDGLADCFDGLLCNGDRERRLAVMHDPRAGALAAVGIAMWLLARVALIAAATDGGRTVEALVCSVIVARAPLTWEAARLPSATPGNGLHALFHRVCPPRAVPVSLLVGGALLAPLAWLEPARAVCGVLLALGATAWWHRTWKGLIGGVNGDVLGAAVEIRELCVLLVYAAREVG